MITAINNEVVSAGKHFEVFGLEVYPCTVYHAQTKAVLYYMYEARTKSGIVINNTKLPCKINNQAGEKMMNEILRPLAKVWRNAADAGLIEDVGIKISTRNRSK